MANKIFINADEIVEELGVSKSYAYKLMKKMNVELKARGFVTIPGRVSRKYYHEKFYGVKPEGQEVV